MSPRRVLMLPDFRAGNPYQQLLADALRGEGWQVAFPAGRRRVLPFRRALGDTPADVVHLHWLHPYLDDRNVFLAVIYALKVLLDVRLVGASGVRLVWTVHNRVPHEARFPAVHHWLSRRLARCADAVLVHSEAAAAEVAAFLGVDADRLTVTGHGPFDAVYGPAPEASEARARLSLPREGRIVVHFGQVRRYKRLEMIIDWWRAEPRGNATLIIVGDCPDAAYAEQLARTLAGTPAGTRIEWRRGRVPDDQVAAWMSAGDEIVSAGGHLTSGVAVLAQSYGKTLTRVGGRERAEETIRPWSEVAQIHGRAYAG